MSRAESRARKRRARILTELDSFRQREAAAAVRNDLHEVIAVREQWAAYLRRLAASAERVWAYEQYLVDPADDSEDADATRAFIGRLVAPHAAARTPAQVHRRHALGAYADPPSE